MMSRRQGTLSAASIGALSLLLVSCAAAPKVGHRLVTKPADLAGDELTTYALQESLVTVKATTTGEGDKKKTTVAVDTDRHDHQRVRIAMLHHKRIGVNTDVAIKKFDNTDIPSEVTVKVEDTRADLVKKTGEIIVAVVKSGIVGFSGEQEAELPARLNLSQLIGAADREELTRQAPGNIEVVFLQLPVDAIETTALDSTSRNAYFYYAACRTARLSFIHEQKPYQFTVKVSDPNFLQRQRMPVDGKITMHSQCGASVTGKLSGDDAAAGLAITSALVAQGQAINEAIKATKEDEEE